MKKIFILLVLSLCWVEAVFARTCVNTMSPAGYSPYGILSPGAPVTLAASCDFQEPYPNWLTIFQPVGGGSAEFIPQSGYAATVDTSRAGSYQINFYFGGQTYGNALAFSVLHPIVPVVADFNLSKCTVGVPYTIDASASYDQDYPQNTQIYVTGVATHVATNSTETFSDNSYINPTRKSTHSFEIAGDYSIAITFHRKAVGLDQTAVPITLPTLLHCGSAPVLSVDNAKIAQSVFYQTNTAKLIQGKPVMARVLISSATPPNVGDNTLVGVKGIFTSPGDSPHEVVGCLRLGDIAATEDSTHPYQGDQANQDDPTSLAVHDTNKNIFLNLFPKVGSQDFPITHDGTFNVQVNPTGGVSGIPAASGCAASSVDYNSTVNQPVLQQPLNFQSYPSPNLRLAYWKLNPPCVGSSCSYDKVADYSTAVDHTSQLVKAMYPISSSGVQKAEDTLNWQLTGTRGIIESFKKYFSKFCGSPNPLPINKCGWELTVQSDLDSLQTAGENADGNSVFPGVNRYVGIAPKASGGQGYFQWLASNTGVYANVVGAAHPSFPKAILFQENSAMVMAHELTHSFGIKFDGSEHENNGTQANGNWLENPNLGNALRLKSDSIMQAAILPEPWQQENQWIDQDTYNKLSSAFLINRQNREHIFDSNQLYISAFASKDGHFLVREAISGLNFNPASEPSNDSAQLQLKNPAGVVLSSLQVPLYYKLDTAGSDGGSVDIDTALMATAVPNLATALSIGVTTSNGVNTEFYPAVEILRSGLEHIPLSTFNDSSAQATLAGTLDEMESQLKSGDLQGAQSKAHIFKSQITGLVRSNFAKKSFDDYDRNKLLSIADQSVAGLVQVAQNFPSLQNGLIRVIPAASIINQNEKAGYAIYVLTQPTNHEVDFSLKASLDGIDQKVSLVNSKQWQLQTQRLIAAGVHSVRFQLYIEHKNLVSTWQKAISSYEEQNLKLSKEFEEETDPEIRAQLQAKMSQNFNAIAALKQNIADDQRAIGSEIQAQLSVQ